RGRSGERLDVDAGRGVLRHRSALAEAAQLPDLVLELAAAALETEQVEEDADPHGGVGGEQVRQMHQVASIRRRTAISSASRAVRMRSCISQTASRMSASDETASPARIHGSTSPEPPWLRVMTAGWMARSMRP